MPWFVRGEDCDFYRKRTIRSEIYYLLPPQQFTGGIPAEEYSKIKKMSGQMNRTKNILVGCIILVLFPRDGFVSIFKK